MATRLLEFLPDPAAGRGADPDELLLALTEWAAAAGLDLYPHQEEAILELLSGSNVILATPTGSGKSLVALAAHARSVAARRAGAGGRSWYTAPVKALVSEKFFDLCQQLGPEHVGLLTGDSAVNPDAPVICATTEILAHTALADGPEADAETVVLDEFHFYGDPDRGWAWQVPLLELPRSSFLLLSATLGDVRFFRDELTRRTGRATVLVDDAVRPVPLRFEYRRTPLHHTIEDLLASDAAPLYLVNFSQKDAVAMASAMSSVTRLGDDAKAVVAGELAAAKLPAGFGRDLARLLRNGVGVHHAGMLPRYRRLVEKLTQQGVLKVVSGTDTLGVGVNLPIRTVVLTRLYKYDGVGNRLLSAREFHQIAGRAGRPGYDTEGLVVALAPEHVAENEAAEAKASASKTDGPKKKRKLKKASPPRGFVHYDEATFERLQSARPEPLESSFRMTPGMLMQLLDRPGDAWAHGRSLLLDNHEPRSRQRRHIREAISLYKALRTAGVVRQLDAPDHHGRYVEVDHELQDDFALDQLLSPFLLAAVPQLEEADESYPLALLALVESVVEDPFPILRAQKEAAKDEAMAEMKAAGVEYEQRMAELEKITHPQPMREQIYDVFDRWRVDNPWIGDRNIAPKGVVRDLWDRAMDFPSFVRHYGIKRSEGLLLRYLSDVYKTLVRAVPDDAKTPEVVELVDWLGAVIRTIDSSLLDEWTALFDPDTDGVDVSETLTQAEKSLHGAVEAVADVTTDRTAFRALVRTRVFRWVQYAATGQWDAWSDDLTEVGDRGWTATKVADLFEPYFEEHASIGIDAEARGPSRFVVADHGDRWEIEQVLADPEGHDEWFLAVTVDLPASAEAGEIVASLHGLRRR